MERKNKILQLQILSVLLSLPAVSGAVSGVAEGATFKEIAEGLKKHQLVEGENARSQALQKEADLQGSWGDPKFKVGAKNFPKDSLADDRTPMTGIEFGVTQKISLTTKYGNIADSIRSLSNAAKNESRYRERGLIKELWEVVIVRRGIVGELNILNENLGWIRKMLRVSKRLYATGKISQQALLDIQIRKAELENELVSKNYELAQIEDRLSYLMDSESKALDYRSIPWGILKRRDGRVDDFKSLALKDIVTSKDLSLTAAKLNYLPDLSFSLNYTKRSDVDGKGDFVGASISFPLPFSGQKYSQHGKAVYEKYRAKKVYENYKREKKRDVAILYKEIKSLEANMAILVGKTIKFAHNSRTITAKSYGLGQSTYVELLQSEFKLQKLLVKKVIYEMQRDIKRVILKHLLGEKLYE